MVTSELVTGFSVFTWLGPIVGPLGTAGLVLAMVIFMLLERRDLRDRLIALFGHGQLTITTKAFDEAGHRVSRQLLMQSLVNVVYGVAAGLGLYFLGVPYPLVWAALGAALRFIPYLGPVLGAGAPILVSLAALQGWAGPLGVVALFVVLELFTNLVLETVLYAGAAGVSQVALLMSVAFWTWLWGPLGLLDGDTADRVPRRAREARPDIGRGSCRVQVGPHRPETLVVGVPTRPIDVDDDVWVRWRRSFRGQVDIEKHRVTGVQCNRRSRSGCCAEQQQGDGESARSKHVRSWTPLCLIVRPPRIGYLYPILGTRKTDTGSAHP